MRSARIAATLLSASVAVAGCGGDDRQKAKPARPAAAGSTIPTGSFVGAATATRGGLVGVVVATGPSGKRRLVEAYLCSPADRLFEWFTGAATGQRVALRSEDGSTLDARVAAGRVQGSVTVAGRRVAFTTHAARGFEGLYEVIVSRDGRLDGASATGAQVQGKVGGGTGTETFTAPDGQQHVVSGPNTFVPGAARSAEAVFVIAGNSRVGGGKSRATRFVDPPTF